MQHSKEQSIVLQNQLIELSCKDKFMQKLKSDYKDKGQRVRIQDFILVHSSSRPKFSFPCQLSKNCTKHHKCTLNTFKNLSYTQVHTIPYATPCCTSIYVNPIQM